MRWQFLTLSVHYLGYVILKRKRMVSELPDLCHNICDKTGLSKSSHCDSRYQHFHQQQNWVWANKSGINMEGSSIARSWWYRVWATWDIGHFNTLLHIMLLVIYLIVTEVIVKCCNCTSISISIGYSSVFKLTTFVHPTVYISQWNDSCDKFMSLVYTDITIMKQQCL